MSARRFLVRFAANALLVLVATLVALVLGEIGLRLAGISYPVFDDLDATRGIALRPGKEGWYRMEGAGYLKINSLGYRDVEHELTKPPGTFRIAVLGDSFAEARQVDLKDTFWHLLGEDLGSCPALGGKRVEVFNFGIGGYATTEELLTLRKDALRFAPDLVLLAFFAGNDVHDNSRELGATAAWRSPRPVHYLDHGRLVLDPSYHPSLSRRLLYEGVQHLRLLEVVNEVRRIWTVRMIRASAGANQDHIELGTVSDIYAPPADPAWQEAWLVTEALLARMNEEARAGGARFVLATITMSEQVHPDPAVRRELEQRPEIKDLLYPDHRIAEIGRQHGFPVINLAERLREVASRDGVYLHGFKNTVMGQGHWNEAGHRLAGKLMSDDLCELLSAPAPAVAANAVVSKSR